MKTVLLLTLIFGTTLTFGQNVEQRLDGSKEYIYKRVSGTELKLHVFSPAGLAETDRRPAIVFFGGGGWIQNDVKQFSPQARFLASRGMVAVVADYRVRSRHNTTPYDSVSDAKSAIRWLREHANELHIDPARLSAGGGSAGGHIALTAAVIDKFDEPTKNPSISSRPNALVLFNPVPTTVAEGSLPLTAEQRQFAVLLGPNAREISPLHHLGKNLPPTIIFHGKDDNLVPFSMVQTFCDKARELGNACEVVGYEGAGHGFFNPRPDDSKWYDETLKKTAEFLGQLGYL